MKRREFIKAAGVIAGTAVAGAPAMARGFSIGTPRADKRPNVLLVLTDQQSADAMSCRMGTAFIRTPAMDSLAQRGVSFTRAYTANPLCIPARTSMLTGQPPHVTGVQTNDLTVPIDARYRCLGAHFRGAGYDTGYFGKWHVPFPAKDPGVHGFDAMGAIKNNGADVEIPAPAAAFIGRRRENPFLLVTSFVNPHNICEWARGEELKDGAVGEPPPPERCPPAVENSAAPAGEADGVLLMRRSYQNNRLFPVGGFDQDKWRQYRWAYFRMIEKVDAHLAVILAALRDSGQIDRTVIVFTSDHGDAQGAHGWNQKTVFYDNVSRVPFIVAGPSTARGGVSGRLVNTGTDLYPTLCELAGIEKPGGLPGLGLRASALSPALADPRRYVVAENRMVQGGPVDGRTPELSGRMVRSARYKYCAYDAGDRRESLFDVQQDPGETVNLAGKPECKAPLVEHRQYLAEWCRETRDPFVAPG
jgi:arylsulfatase A-like enzyme